MPKRWIDNNGEVNSEGRGRGLFPGVMHPGVKKRPFIKPASDSLRPKMRETIAREAGRNIRLVIRDALKVQRVT